MSNFQQQQKYIYEYWNLFINCLEIHIFHNKSQTNIFLCLVSIILIVISKKNRIAHILWSYLHKFPFRDVLGFFVVFKAYPFWRGTHSYNYLKEVNVLSSACGLIFLTTWIRRKSLMWKWLVKTICGIHLAITYKLRFWRKSWERLMFLGWNWMKWVWSLIEAIVPNLER